MSAPAINNIVQVGLVVHNVDVTVANYRRLLNLQDWNISYVDTENGKGRNFRTGNKPIMAKAKIAWINIGNVELELIEPQDEVSVYAKFLGEHGPGMHHLMLATLDYDKCTESMVKNNIAVIGSGELQQSRFQMFDTEADLGFICEIAEGEALIPDYLV